jgi:magnesium transporter
MIGGMEVRLITGAGVQRRPVDELPALLARRANLVWLDIPECDEQAVRVLADVFRFHPMAIQDLAERNRVPKMHAYADHVLVVLHSPERGERGHVHFVELDQIFGPNYLVTAHGPINPALEPKVAQRETNAVVDRIQTGRLHPTTPLQLSYAIISALTRKQEDYVEAATTDVWRLEQQVTSGRLGEDTERFLNELFQVRHGLFAVRTMGALSYAIYLRVAKLACISPAERPIVDDIADQFERVRSVADGEREYLQGVIEFYQTVLDQTRNEEIRHLTRATYTQNEELKKISGWAAIAFAPTLIATVYGMNFTHMPELDSVWGYPIALLAMAISATAIYLLFKRVGWL